jgi:hypothetical protein
MHFENLVLSAYKVERRTETVDIWELVVAIGVVVGLLAVRLVRMFWLACEIAWYVAVLVVDPP